MHETTPPTLFLNWARWSIPVLLALTVFVGAVFRFAAAATLMLGISLFLVGLVAGLVPYLMVSGAHLIAGSGFVLHLQDLRKRWMRAGCRPFTWRDFKEGAMILLAWASIQFLSPLIGHFRHGFPVDIYQFLVFIPASAITFLAWAAFVWNDIRVVKAWCAAIQSELREASPSS